MSRRRMRGAIGTVGLVLVAITTACGGGHEHDTGAATAGRVVEVSMTDMVFTPASLAVAKGETVTFRFRNDGAVLHEAVLGDEAYQSAHAASMQSATTEAAGHSHDMDHAGHGAGTSVTVKPGKTADLTYTFDDAGTVLLGCHQPGHYEAGMKATIAVA